MRRSRWMRLEARARRVAFGAAAAPVAVVLAASACGAHEDTAPVTAPPPAPPADAMVVEIPQAGTFDPLAGRHLDGDPAPTSTPRAPDRRAAQRPIEITLRSTPVGAIAAVDGVNIGKTPTYWSGDANGHEHTFTFVEPGYAVALYRFVPITSGVLFGRLDSVTMSAEPAGVSPTSPAAPSLSSAPIPPPAPPPTIVSPKPVAPPPVPADAAPAPPVFVPTPSDADGASASAGSSAAGSAGSSKDSELSPNPFGPRQ